MNSKKSLYSYIVTRDYGFAPNPFWNVCTLATCKPKIRLNAKVNDWVVGIGSARKDSPYKNKIIYAMRINEKITFDQYWIDPRFQNKKPIMNSGKRYQYGDNIYYTKKSTKKIVQVDSHHSLPNGIVNNRNLKRDIPGKYVLISYEYWYFGEKAIAFPNKFMLLSKLTRGHKNITDKKIINDFEKWIRISKYGNKMVGLPILFRKNFTRYAGE